jgi:phosphatidylinositol alpha-1,6-mannosyltransferase
VRTPHESAPRLPKTALVLAPAVHGADGISAATRAVASSLVQAGVETRILALADTARRDLAESPPRVPVVSASGSRARFLLGGLAASLRRRPEIVIATHLRLLAAAAPLIAARVPVAVMLQGVECWKPLAIPDRVLLGRACHLLAISRWTRDRFLAANPRFAGHPLSVCPLGIDVRAPVPVAPPVPGRVLVVGRLWTEERYKGHDLLIDVWQDVRRAVPHAHLVIVGDGDDRARLEARVREAGLAQAIRFTGALPHAELQRAFVQAQLFAMPSDGEGFGLVYLEAMRAARPCLAARGAAEEIVIDGVTGRIVPPRDRAALAAALVEMLSDPTRCSAMGRAGRERVENEFSSARFAARLLETLSGVPSGC